MNGLTGFRCSACAVILGDNHRCTGGKTHEEAHQQVDNGTSGAAHGSQRLGSHEIAHNNGVHRVVQLLKKGSQQNGEEEGEQLFPDNAFRDFVFLNQR